MHELSVAIELYRASRNAVESRGGGPIVSVAVAVGELSAVEPELLQFAWEAIIGGSSDDGATLEIEWRPAGQRCATCGPIDQRQPGTWMRLCPACSRPLSVEGGRELDILTIEFDSAAAEEEVRV